MKRKRTNLERLLHVLDEMKIEYAKANVEVKNKKTGETSYLIVIQNAFCFDRMTGKYQGTHWGNLMRPEGAPPLRDGKLVTQSEIKSSE